MVQSAVDLANAVKSDLRDNNGLISSATVVLLDDFKKQHDDLDTILDVINGIQ